MNQSKVIAIISVAIGVLLIGAFLYVYNSQTNEIETLKDVVEQVKTDNEVKDKYIEEIALAISKLQRSINTVGENQLVISNLSSEIRSGVLSPEAAKSKIVSTVNLIDSIIETSQNKIRSLQNIAAQRRRRIKVLSNTAASLEKTLTEMSEALKAKETEIASLKQEIEELTRKVGNLTEEVKTKSAKIKDQDLALRTAYYTIGQERDLYEKKMIEYQGGILGIASTPVVSKKLNDSLMTQVDTKEFKSLYLEKNKNDIRILTSHEPSSFIMTAEGDNKTRIIIDDPSTFWKRSKYFVVMYY